MDDSYWMWGKNASHPRILHAMIRVRNLDRSLDFYCNKLGMKVISQTDFEQGRFTIVFVNFSDDFDSGAIELTHNWDGAEDYHHGSGYGHVAIGVPDLAAFHMRLTKLGVEFTVEPKVMIAGAPPLAFVRDPDGYSIELIQTGGYVET